MFQKFEFFKIIFNRSWTHFKCMRHSLVQIAGFDLSFNLKYKRISLVENRHKFKHQYRGRFVEQKLALSCSFGCDPTRKSQCYEFWPHFVVLLKSPLWSESWCPSAVHLQCHPGVKHIISFSSSLILFENKLECLSLKKLSFFPTLACKFRRMNFSKKLDWLQETNTLAYYVVTVMTIFFVALPPIINVIKLFKFITDCVKKKL